LFPGRFLAAVGKTIAKNLAMKNKQMKKVLVLLPIFTSLISPVGFCQSIYQRLDSQFVRLVRAHEFNGNVLVAEQGKAIYRKSFGPADTAKGLANSPETNFNLASVSKTFTAVAVLQLLEQGKLGLDDPLVKYFPEFPAQKITIRQLLSHTSGLVDYQMFEGPHRVDPGKIFTNADLIPAIKADSRAFAAAAGERWNYSNTGYGLLALLVEQLSGLKFQDYLARHIFKPAGMTSSYLTSPLLPVTDPKRAVRYDFLPYAPEVLKPVDSVRSDYIDVVVLGAILGPTAVVSSTSDMLKYDQALYTGKLLKAKTLALAFQPAILNSGEKADTGWGGTRSYYGLGWMILKDSTYGKVVWHSGGAAGIVTAFLRNLDKRQTLVVLDNVTHRGLHADVMDAFYLLNGGAIAPKKRSAAQAYVTLLHKQGAEQASAQLLYNRADTSGYFLDEREMNRLGYSLAADGFLAEGLEVFKINTFLFPASFNAYDSYADLLRRSGKRQQAILMYERSLALNPKNEGGQKALAELKADVLK
jgi:CubicO group peptidase (beta-lactamase class C family)